MNLAFSNSISSIVLRSICHLSGEFSWSLIQEDFFQAQKQKKENISIHVFTSINPRRRALLLYIPQPLTVSIAFLFSIESLLHQTNIRDSAVIRVQAFSIAQNVPKWRQSVNKRSFSHGTVCTNKFKYLLGGPLSWTPFLEKGPLKLQRGAHLTLSGQFLE